MKKFYDQLIIDALARFDKDWEMFTGQENTRESYRRLAETAVRKVIVSHRDSIYIKKAKLTQYNGADPFDNGWSLLPADFVCFKKGDFYLIRQDKNGALVLKHTGELQYHATPQLLTDVDAYVYEMFVCQFLMLCRGRPGFMAFVPVIIEDFSKAKQSLQLSQSELRRQYGDTVVEE